MAVDIGDLVEQLLGGERRAVARALTVIEDGELGALRGLVGGIYASTGSAQVIGITGSPGVGKSTLTNAVAAELRARDRTVGVLAVDPSSPFSGGALLGDRVRMQSHHADPGVFIRSMAARGHLGGLSVATPQAVLVLDAAGFDVVIVETVGVGQSEVEVAATADTTVVALAPGMGDSIQAAKAGILEVADLFVINKADQQGARRLESDIKGMLELGHAVGSDRAWQPPIVHTVATEPRGITELVEQLGAHRQHLRESGELDERLRHRALHAVREIALERVRDRFQRLDDDGDPLLGAIARKVAARELDPYGGADELLAAVEG